MNILKFIFLTIPASILGFTIISAYILVNVLYFLCGIFLIAWSVFTFWFIVGLLLSLLF